MAEIIKADYQHVIDRVHRRLEYEHCRLPAAYYNADVEAAAKVLRGCTTHVKEQDNFTIVTLFDEDKCVSIGVSKRHPDDISNPIIGYNVALVRAIEIGAYELMCEFHLQHIKPNQNGQQPHYPTLRERMSNIFR